MARNTRSPEKLKRDMEAVLNGSGSSHLDALFYFKKHITNVVNSFCNNKKELTNSQLEKVLEYVNKKLVYEKFFISDFESLKCNLVIKKIYDRVVNEYENYSERSYSSYEKYVMLTTLDSHWKTHVAEMDELRRGIGLRVYGPDLPIVAYRNESYSMFEEMMNDVYAEVSEKLLPGRVIEKGDNMDDKNKKELKYVAFYGLNGVLYVLGNVKKKEDILIPRSMVIKGSDVVLINDLPRRRQNVGGITIDVDKDGNIAVAEGTRVYFYNLPKRFLNLESGKISEIKGTSKQESRQKSQPKKKSNKQSSQKVKPKKIDLSSKKQANNFVVFVSNGVLCFVGNTPDDLSKIKSSIITRYFENGGKKAKSFKLDPGTYSVEGTIVKVLENGEISVSDTVACEFYNQSTKKIKSNSKNNVDVVALLTLARNKKSKELEILINYYGEEQIWKAFDEAIDNGTISKNDLSEFASKSYELVSDDIKNTLFSTSSYKAIYQKYFNDGKKTTNGTSKNREATVREAKPGLLKRIKSKFKGKKFLKKAIMAVLLAGIITAVTPNLVSDSRNAIDNAIQEGITYTISNDEKDSLDDDNEKDNNEIISNDDIDNETPELNNNDIDEEKKAVDEEKKAVDDETLYLGYDELHFEEIGKGDTVYESAYDAIEGTNKRVANEWFSSEPNGVYNVSTHQYTEFDPEELKDEDVLRTIFSDPDNVLTFGDKPGLENVDGFMNRENVTKEITKGSNVVVKVLRK